MAGYEYNEDMLGDILPVYEYLGATGLQVTFTSEASYVEPYNVEDFKDYARIDFDTDDFEVLGQHLEQKCEIQVAKVGQAVARMADMRSLVDAATIWFASNRG